MKVAKLCAQFDVGDGVLALGAAGRPLLQTNVAQRLTIFPQAERAAEAFATPGAGQTTVMVKLADFVDRQVVLQESTPLMTAITEAFYQHVNPFW
jgi:hypothetical protein